MDFETEQKLIAIDLQREIVLREAELKEARRKLESMANICFQRGMRLGEDPSLYRYHLKVNEMVNQVMKLRQALRDLDQRLPLGDAIVQDLFENEKEPKKP